MVKIFEDVFGSFDKRVILVVRIILGYFKVFIWYFVVFLNVLDLIIFLKENKEYS